MSKARHVKSEPLTPLDLVLARFDMNQIELAAALGKDRSLPSQWRNRYKGFIPPAAWSGIIEYAEEHDKQLTLEELRSGGTA